MLTDLFLLKSSLSFGLFEAGGLGSLRRIRKCSALSSSNKSHSYAGYFALFLRGDYPAGSGERATQSRSLFVNLQGRNLFAYA